MNTINSNLEVENTYDEVGSNNMHKSMFIRFNLKNGDDKELYEMIQEYMDRHDYSNITWTLKRLIKNALMPIIEGEIVDENNENVVNRDIESIEHKAEVINLTEEISQTCEFIRGQIWHWKDPIVGNKSMGNKIHNNEGTLRYSRYVIIMQNSNTINNSALCIPLSSHYNDPNDIEVTTKYQHNDSISYARIRQITPINVKQLDRYICTLSSECLLKLSLGLSRLLLNKFLYKTVKYQVCNIYGEQIVPKLLDIKNTEDNNLYIEEQFNSNDVSVDNNNIENTEDENNKNEIEKSKIHDSQKEEYQLNTYDKIILFTIGQKEISATIISKTFNISYSTGYYYMEKLYKDSIIVIKYKNKPRKVVVNCIDDFNRDILERLSSYIDIIQIILNKKQNKEEIDLESILETETKENKLPDILIIRWGIKLISKYVEYKASYKNIYYSYFGQKKKNGKRNESSKNDFYNKIASNVRKSLLELLSINGIDNDKNEIIDKDKLNLDQETINYIVQFYDNNCKRNGLYMNYQLPNEYSISGLWYDILYKYLLQDYGPNINIKQLQQFIISTLQ